MDNKLLKDELNEKTVVISEHRIDAEEEEKIMALVDSILQERPDMSDEEKEIIQYKANRYRSFQMKNAIFRTKRVKNPTKVYTRRLTWNMLPELMEIVGFGYKEILEAVCSNEREEPFVLKWATKEQERMCKLCDNYLSKSGREKLLEFIVGITSPEFRDRVELDESPIRKLFRFTTWSESRSGVSRDKVKELGMEKEFLARFSQSSQSTLTLEQIVTLAETFKVSVHWMLGANQDEIVLAKNGTTEVIMDYFCLFTEEIQQCIIEGLELHFGIGGAL